MLQNYQIRKFIHSVECRDLSGEWRSSDGGKITLTQDKCKGSSSDGFKYIATDSSMTFKTGVTGIIDDKMTKITFSDGTIFIPGNIHIILMGRDSTKNIRSIWYNLIA